MGKKALPDAASSHSSLKLHVSRKAAKVMQTLKAGMKALTRPLKCLRKAASSSKLSCTSSRVSTYTSKPDTISIHSDSGSAEALALTDAISIHSSTSSSNEGGLEENDAQELTHLQATWRSPVYTFFKSNVSVEYYNGCKCHFFPCAARKCKNPLGGVRRYQDSKDKAFTLNLKTHAINCFGAAAVEAAIKGDKAPRDGSIFAVFAHTWKLVKWVTESNHPVRIVSDREFQELMMAGHPTLVLPSSMTLARDIKSLFEHCRERIGQLLREHPGHLNFATDAWTSPNHCAFVAWTVHLEFQGYPLSFLLDVIEVLESHTGQTLAREFQAMLVRYGIEQKILTFNGNNATSNDKQTTELAKLPNSFEEVHRVRCFNHTLQLSAKSLLKPFNAALAKLSDLQDDTPDDLPDLLGPDDDGDDDDDDDVENAGMEFTDEEEIYKEVDGLAELDDDAREALLNETADVQATLTKIHQLAFAIIHSSTIALPAWCEMCQHYKLRVRIIPRDVVTRWSSTYDMLSFAIRYRQPINAITADKVLKLRKYELDMDDWQIAQALMQVLKKYKKATLFFSQDSISTIANVIPTTSFAGEQSVPPAIQSVMGLARTTMNRYYSKTDLSSIYRIAMVLHPSLKLEYFKQRSWDQTWIDTAENITREEYIAVYEEAATLQQ
ncbi:hypothetical protein SCP_0406300 [Sparassis crispa]|uniref:AC transposase n=1 Tax=Sparassis crispa TaxID=139825 RepID=A0A401GJA4_9APHY|nr:hypothetical protein SCP_0406300 [Sparassis crispa]GBE82246.1 hypothetical protein SCP_0406300 [Sparassis crispa]